MKPDAIRTGKVELQRQNELISHNNAVITLLNGLNLLAIIINPKKEIVFINNKLGSMLGTDISQIIGLRPGELMKCKYSDVNELGCGFAPECALCKAQNLVVKVIADKIQRTDDVSIISLFNDIEVTSNFNQSANNIKIEDEDFYAVFFIDRSSEVEKENLERIFFHDIMNTASGISNLIQLMRMTRDDIHHIEEIDLVEDYSSQLINEIMYQRDIIAAEKGQLEVKLTEFSLLDLIDSVLDFLTSNLKYTEITISKKYDFDKLTITSDKTLLSRILINIVKNALEANRDNSEITINILYDESITIIVSNNEVIPVESRPLIFGKGVSTKGTGRGFGMYSSKLLTEKYLNGQISFTSKEESGTSFIINLP